MISLCVYSRELQKDKQMNVIMRKICQVAAMKMMHCCSLIGGSAGDLGSLYTTFGTTITLVGTCTDARNQEEKETAAIENEPEQEATIDAIKEQPVIVANKQNDIDDDEHRRYPRSTRRPVERLGL